MSEQDKIKAFLAGHPHAVVGASRERWKYGNKVLRAFQRNPLPVFPVNPHTDEVEGLVCYPDLQSLPGQVHGVSVITPPAVTERIMEQAAALGIKHVWLQPGAESQRAIEIAVNAGIDLLAGGPCILIALQYRESP